MTSSVRKLVKQGWTEVTVPRKNLHGWNQPGFTKELGNTTFALEMIEWCRERFDPLTYSYSMPTSAAWVVQNSREHGCNRFVFRQEADAVMFKLRWLE
jgi:hypothetical protein